MLIINKVTKKENKINIILFYQISKNKTNLKFKPIGYLTATIEGTIYKIENCFIRKKFRDQRFGMKIVTKLIQIAIKNNVDEIYITDKYRNARFFKKLGFIEHENKKFLSISNILEEKKKSRKGTIAITVSIFVNLFISIFKIIAGIVGNSAAVMADGTKTFIVAATSAVGLLFFQLSYKPENEDFPYGHGEFENIGGTILGVLLILTSFEILYQLFQKHQSNMIDMHEIKFLLGILLISVVLKLLIFIYKKKVAKQLNSSVLKISAKKDKVNYLTTFGVFIGILFTIYVNPIFDTITGLILCVLIFKEGVKAIVETSDNILDKQDFIFLSKIKTMIENKKEIKNAYDFMMKTSGKQIYISLRVNILESMNIKEAGEIFENIEWEIKKRYKFVKRVIIQASCMPETLIGGFNDKK